MNFILDNQRAIYNKVSIGYEYKNNDNSFSNICHANVTSKCNILICNYCGKKFHVALLEKNYESKHDSSYIISIRKT